jgi:hypothetical protein
LRFVGYFDQLGPLTVIVLGGKFAGGAMWEPMFCELGAWSNESPELQMMVLSRSGSVLAQRRKRSGGLFQERR